MVRFAFKSKHTGTLSIDQQEQKEYQREQLKNNSWKK